MRTLPLLTALLAPLTALAAPPTAPVTEAPEPAAHDLLTAWREDLAFLARELPARHINPFTKTTREDFDAAIAELDARLPGLAEHEVAVAFMQIAALLGDSHTTVDVPFVQQGRLPILLSAFSDGCYIVAATREHEDLIGARIEAIGGIPVNEAIARLATIRAFENAAHRSTALPDWGNAPVILSALGLTDQPTHARFSLSLADGSTREVDLQSPAADPAPEWVVKPAQDDPRRPISRRGRSEWYWFEPIGADAIYIRYDRCSNQPDRPFAAFAAEALAAIDAHPGCRIIIDLRRNGGGDSSVMMPLLSGLVGRTQTRGPLIALMGPRTFSSGMMNALQLKRAGATLMGEPTGQHPNAFGEIRSFELPNTRWSVWYSTKRFDLMPGSTDESLMPDITVETDSRAWFAAQDPVLEAALTFQPEVSSEANPPSEPAR